MECSPPGSRVHEISQARILVDCHFFYGDIHPVIEPRLLYALLTGLSLPPWAITLCHSFTGVPCPLSSILVWVTKPASCRPGSQNSISRPVCLHEKNTATL